MTMNNTLSKIIVFAAGAVVGSAVTWKIVKTKYEQIAQEEIDSVKEFYSMRQKNVCESTEDSEEVEAEESAFDEEDMEDYEEMIEKSGYTTESNETIQNDGEAKKEMDRPYVISPSEYDENGYDTITLKYYENNVLVDEFGGVMPEDIWEEYVGADFAEHFGEYEEDSVFVRNDTFGIDYEILKVLEDYTGDN